jgi:hypothetical protein
MSICGASPQNAMPEHDYIIEMLHRSQPLELKATTNEEAIARAASKIGIRSLPYSVNTFRSRAATGIYRIGTLKRIYPPPGV